MRVALQVAVRQVPEWPEWSPARQRVIFSCNPQNFLCFDKDGRVNGRIVDGELARLLVARDALEKNMAGVGPSIGLYLRGKCYNRHPVSREKYPFAQVREQCCWQDIAPIVLILGDLGVLGGDVGV